MHERNLIQCDHAVEQFWKGSNKTNTTRLLQTKKRRKKQIPKILARRAQLGQEVRRSARIQGLKGSRAEEFVNLLDTKFKTASTEDKIRYLCNNLMSDDLPPGCMIKDGSMVYTEDSHDSTNVFEAASDLAEIKDNAETIDLSIRNFKEFPKPPVFGPAHIHVVEDICEEEIIALAFDGIISLLSEVGDEFETAPENDREMLRGNRTKEFIEAEHKELFQIYSNGTVEIVICPKNRKPIPCRWVYDIKRNEHNEIVRFKARLVVQGFRQIEGIDFQKTFSSVAQLRTFRTLVALSIRFGLTITQYDISTAFLNADVDTEIFMKFPPRYPPDNDNEVFKLLKALYGLRQASRLWKEMLVGIFNDAGLKMCQSESGVVYSTKEDKSLPISERLCLVCIHVDDYGILTGNEQRRKEIESVMDRIFKVQKMGELKLYLGIVHESGVRADGRRTAKLHQGPYLERLVKKMNYDKATTAKTPDLPSVKQTVLDCPGEDDEKVEWPYISCTGSVMYAACGTRPDLARHVNSAARYNKNPGKNHVLFQKQGLKYIKGTTHRGLIFTEPLNIKDEKVDIMCFVDTDWAGCSDTRRSTVGFIIQICGGSVAWCSRLMKTLALSSCEAEFMGLTEVAREIMWFIRFFQEVGIEYNTPKIFCDSASAILWAEDPVQHQRNKHVELKYYFIRDLVGEEIVKLYKISGLNNPADPLTKVNTRSMVERLVPVIMGESEPTFDE